MSRGSDGWSLLVQRRDDLAPEPGTVSKNDQGLQLLLHDQASSVHKKCGCDCSSPAGTHTNHGAEAYPGFGKETLYHRLRSLRVKSFQQHNINLQCHQSAAQATPLQWAKNRTWPEICCKTRVCSVNPGFGIIMEWNPRFVVKPEKKEGSGCARYIYIDLCVFQYPKTYLFFLLCQLCPRPRSPGIPVPIHAPSPPWMASRVARCWKRCLSAQKQQGWEV